MTDKDLLAALRIDPAQRGSSGGRRRWPWLLAVLLLLAAGIGGWAAWSDQAIKVHTQLVTESTADNSPAAVLDATGYVTARREATVSSKITGKLQDVLIEEGDRVEQGQLLARLDPVEQKAQLELAKAQADAAHAQLGELEAQLQQAERDLKRQKELGVKGLTAVQSQEDASTKVTSLSAQLRAQQMQIAVAEAQVRLAQVNYDETFIYAPFTGVITAKAAQPGEIVSPISAGGGFTRTGVGTIVDMDSLEIEVDVNEAYINRVQPQQQVEAVLDAYPDWHIPAQVIAIIPAADRSKATVKVRIALLQKDQRIVPDMGVRVSFLEPAKATDKSPANALLVPVAALTQRQSQNVVFVVHKDQAEQRDVGLGQVRGDLREISSGLKAGEQVIVDPDPRLQDGSRVQVQP